MPDFTLRVATNRDCDSIIQLIDTVLQEYEDHACLEDSEVDLTDIEANYHSPGSQFVVLLESNRIIGTHAVQPLAKNKQTCTFRRLYVAEPYRGKSAGDTLMDWAISFAVESGYSHVEFWSDTRFQRAHKFFERFAFVKTGEVREMHDSFRPYSEFKFTRRLRIEPSIA